MRGGLPPDEMYMIMLSAQMVFSGGTVHSGLSICSLAESSWRPVFAHRSEWANTGLQYASVHVSCRNRPERIRSGSVWTLPCKRSRYCSSTFDVVPVDGVHAAFIGPTTARKAGPAVILFACGQAAVTKSS